MGCSILCTLLKESANFSKGQKVSDDLTHEDSNGDRECAKRKNHS